MRKARRLLPQHRDDAPLDVGTQGVTESILHRESLLAESVLHSMEKRKMSKSPLKNSTKPMAPDAAVKPSTADYPVEPAERVSQQERLRKAAAAGADALKSPLSSLMSGSPSSPVAIPQKPAEPRAPLTQSTSSMEPAPKPNQDLRSEIPSPRGTAGPQLKENEEILAELKKIAAWADMQRKITKWSFIVIAVLIPAMIGAGILMEHQATANLEATITHVTRQKPDWYDVEHNVRAGDFEKAIGIGEELILKTPQFPEAHQRLARAYLASGNIEKAREHFAEAFRLFPSEENEKLLEAVDKRSKADKP
jgi:hypothetical protein